MKQEKAIAEKESSKAVKTKQSTGEEYLAQNLEMLTKISVETSKTIDLMTSKIESSQAGDQLLMDNMATLNALTKTAVTTAQNVDYVYQKLESIASHLIAVEVVLAEIASASKLDMGNIVSIIRNKIAAATDGKGDPAKAIDIATLLISK